jgi:hypothetical protein
MNNPDHISESLETIFWVKMLKFFDVDPGSGMENSDPGKNIPIRNTGNNDSTLLSYPNYDPALALQVEILLVTDDSVPAQLQHLQPYSSPHLSGQLLM